MRSPSAGRGPARFCHVAAHTPGRTPALKQGASCSCIRRPVRAAFSRNNWAVRLGRPMDPRPTKCDVGTAGKSSDRRLSRLILRPGVKQAAPSAKSGSWTIAVGVVLARAPPHYCASSYGPLLRERRTEMSLFNIGFVVFPDLTQLDFTGPLQVLSRLPQSATHIIAKSEAPVPSDCGLGLVPTHTFAN